MAKLTYFVLSENYIFTDGKATLVNVYDTVTTSEFPTAVKGFTISAAIRDVTEEDLVDGKVHISMIVHNEEGDEFVKIESEQEVAVFPSNVATSADLGGKFQFQKEEKFIGKLYVNDNEIGELAFEVKRVEAE